jgi:hypothetical protein
VRPQKPKTLDEYRDWLRSGLRLDLSLGYEPYYRIVASSLQQVWAAGAFWTELRAELAVWNDEYRLTHNGLALLSGPAPDQPATKPYRSLLDKSFRRNVVENRAWPAPPKRGWTMHPSWFTTVGDIVRTTLVVEYLDGVDFLANKLAHLAQGVGAHHRIYWEARDTGYYAGHFYVTDAVNLPSWGTPEVLESDSRLEIQITTRLKATLRSLTHPYYESRRSQPRAVRPWQWSFQSDEFMANYLGHTLHFLEGVMIEVRDRAPRDIDRPT